MKTETQHIKAYGIQQKRIKRKVYNNKLHLKNTCKINNLTMNCNELEEQQQIKSKSGRRKEITKIKEEVNHIETNKYER